MAAHAILLVYCLTNTTHSDTVLAHVLFSIEIWGYGWSIMTVLNKYQVGSHIFYSVVYSWEQMFVSMY